MLTTFNELAEAELNDAIGYYETEQVGLGAAFLAEIRRSTVAIIEYPGASPTIRGTVRRRLRGSALGVRRTNPDVLTKYIQASRLLG